MNLYENNDNNISKNSPTVTSKIQEIRVSEDSVTWMNYSPTDTFTSTIYVAYYTNTGLPVTLDDTLEYSFSSVSDKNNPHIFNGDGKYVYMVTLSSDKPHYRLGKDYEFNFISELP